MLRTSHQRLVRYMSPASSITVFCPLPSDKILQEEKMELDLPVINYGGPITIIPWRSMLAEGCLDTLNSLRGKAHHATILKFEYENDEIKWWINTLNFKKLYCTSTNATWPIANLAYPDYISPLITVNPTKDYDFSFIGWENNYLRRTLFQRYAGRPGVIPRDSYSYGVELTQTRNKDNANQYINILSRSRFSLCPRGIGNGTKRFWESLRAGAIPILMSDTFAPPACWDWAKTIIRINEWSAVCNDNKIPVATVLPTGRESEMRENCRKAAAAFSDPLFVTEYIKSTINGDCWKL